MKDEETKKFVLRCPTWVWEALMKASQNNRRSLNSQVVACLERDLERAGYIVEAPE
ncbi:Arc family DNA-binding protein [Pseudomonas aeruginosa]|uniref:Arc family DNA-binding protein n=1 Tax=Pseudomonas aeruginosa TaxID=287 RepID=UPI003D9C7427